MLKFLSSFPFCPDTIYFTHGKGLNHPWLCRAEGGLENFEWSRESAVSTSIDFSKDKLWRQYDDDNFGYKYVLKTSGASFAFLSDHYEKSSSTYHFFTVTVWQMYFKIILKLKQVLIAMI